MNTGTLEIADLDFIPAHAGKPSSIPAGFGKCAVTADDVFSLVDPDDEDVPIALPVSQKRGGGPATEADVFDLFTGPEHNRVLTAQARAFVHDADS